MTHEELNKSHQDTITKHAGITALHRYEHQTVKAKLDALEAQFKAEHATLIAQVSELDDQAKAAETTLRTAALNAYHATGEKKWIDGVEIKLWDSAEYDPVEALKWCRGNMVALLELNTKAYEKVLRERTNNKTLAEVLPDMPGKVSDEAKPSIARDLAQYLPVEDVAA